MGIISYCSAAKWSCKITQFSSNSVAMVTVVVRSWYLLLKLKVHNRVIIIDSNALLSLPDMYDLRLFLTFYLALCFFLFPETIKLFVFQTCCLWEYLMNLVPETHLVCYIWYIRFYLRNMFNVWTGYSVYPYLGQFALNKPQKRYMKSLFCSKQLLPVQKYSL